jgi:hypothetical protein
VDDALCEVKNFTKILMGNFIDFIIIYRLAACVILTHIHAVWQFRQTQTPEDGHVGPKHVVLGESGK